jgi:hypothetical protein
MRRVVSFSLRPLYKRVRNPDIYWIGGFDYLAVVQPVADEITCGYRIRSFFINVIIWYIIIIDYNLFLLCVWIKGARKM